MKRKFTFLLFENVEFLRGQEYESFSYICSRKTVILISDCFTAFWLP
ncbi:MAG: hypothetical protein FD166_2312 [Bacteroidetes bacterium]|nr:MAG: hypothetical protein FD166_2312 [Bacteroidota bacterium]